MSLILGSTKLQLLPWTACSSCVPGCSTVAALRAAGCEVQLEVLPGKGHGMISSQEEMRSCMQFWAQHLRRRPADPNFVEVA